METLPAPVTSDDRNFFHEPNNAYIGDYVRTTNGTKYRGIVYDCHYWCPEDDTWLEMQSRLGPEPSDWKRCRWVSILVHGGGAVTVPDQLVEVIEPFDIDNNNMGMYFRQ